MDLTDIFGGGDETSSVDAGTATAAVIMKKLAAEQGMDLTAMSETELADLYDQLRGATPSETTTVPEQEKVAMEFTNADVAAEMAKVASANNVDLDAMDQAAKAEFFDKVAQAMQTEEYWSAQQEAAQFEKQAHQAVELGELMAEAHAVKLAELLGIELMDKEAAGKMDAIRGAAGKAKDWVMAPVKTMREAKAIRSQGSNKGSLKDKLKDLGTLASAHKGQAAAAGGLGLAAAGGVGAGAHRAMRKKESSIDAAATELARDFLLENGIDPDTGAEISEEKVASAVNERAIEILREAGYNV